jgi:hypothetical protein
LVVGAGLQAEIVVSFPGFVALWLPDYIGGDSGRVDDEFLDSQSDRLAAVT